TPSVGRATRQSFKDFQFRKFLSTPSVGRATPKSSASASGAENFYPRPPWGGRLQKCLKNSCTFVSNHTIGSLIYREILPELQRNRQNNLCFTPKIRCDSPG